METLIAIYLYVAVTATAFLILMQLLLLYYKLHLGWWNEKEVARQDEQYRRMKEWESADEPEVFRVKRGGLSAEPDDSVTAPPFVPTK